MRRWGFCLFCGLLLFSCNRHEEAPPAADGPGETAPAPVADGVEPSAPKPRVPTEVYYPPAPDLPPAADTIKIAVISDINGGYGTIGYSPRVKAAVQDIVRRGFDFVLCAGDMVAGQKMGLDYDAMWKAFHYQVDDVFFDNNLEFVFAPGNHDASSFPQFTQERAAFERAFANRRPRQPLYDGSRFPFYYGLTLRGVRLIVLDITRPITNRDPQLDWLELALLEPGDYRATIVIGHLPLAPINFTQYWEVAGSSRLISILQRTPNTLYISGHHHIYYPGHIGELRTVAMPALGSNPRRLGGAPAVPGYVEIVIAPEAPPRVYALVAPDFTRIVDHRSLPQNVGQLQREDVGMASYIVDLLDDQAKTGNSESE